MPLLILKVTLLSYTLSALIKWGTNAVKSHFYTLYTPFPIIFWGNSRPGKNNDSNKIPTSSALFFKNNNVKNYGQN